MSHVVNETSFQLEYECISHFYGAETAKRSGVPLMNHIDEGLAIMEKNGASVAAKAAFCIHPMLQSDEEFQSRIYGVMALVSSRVLMLALEYRRAANAYLCKPYTDDWTQFEISQAVGYLLPEVKDMLIADKLQNQKDFQIHHLGKHHRSDKLDAYFIKWIEYLAKNLV